jgi:Tat protein secretion system quality control protein TatD with DNase activity
MKIIDCHTHPCFDIREYKRIAERNGIDFSLQGLLQEMKENNVERAIAISLYVPNNGSIADLSKENNVRECVKTFLEIMIKLSRGV